MQPLVSVITLNWNGGNYIHSCLEHLLNQRHDNVEIIVVDNGSSDGSIESVEERYPTLRIIRNDRNLGFCKGMNQGINASKGAYVIPLNFDAFLAEDFIAEAVKAAETDERIGMVGGKVFRFIDGQKSNAIDNVGLFLRKRMALVNSHNRDEEEFTFGPSGCCPTLRREMLEDVQISPSEYFDETYFAFGEDIDLWFRAQLRGWKCLFTPRAIAWHVHSASVKGMVRKFDKPPRFQKHSLKNRYLTMVKDFPFGLMLYLLPYLLVAESGLWAYLLFTKPKSLFSVLLPTMGETLRLLPQALHKRRKIQARRRVPSAYLRRFFIGF